MTIVADNFTRANSGSLGANWTEQLANSFSIVSNSANDAAGFNAVYACWTANNFAPDQFSQIQINGINSSDFAGPCVRMSKTANTAYEFVTNGSSGSGNTFLRKVVAGTLTTLISISTTVASGDTLRLEVFGTTLTAKKNGVVVGTTTDSSITSGFPGIEGFGSANSLNLFVGGDYADGMVTMLGAFQ